MDHKTLSSLLDYNPETGDLIWLKSGRNGVRLGDVAGGKSNGYIVIRVLGRLYRAHRLAWFLYHGQWPNVVDHINRDKSDNRIANLRSVTPAESLRNMPLPKDNTSGCCGVIWIKRERKWTARIGVNRKKKSLGYYDDWFDAVCARKAAENRYRFHTNHGRMSASDN